MGNKSWLITAAPLIIGLAFTGITFATDQEVNETHVQLLDWLLVAFLGSAATGAAKSGHNKYLKYKEKHPDPT